MTAARALDRLCVVIFAEQKSLHLSSFKRLQNASQPRNAAPVGTSLANCLGDELVAMSLLPLRKNALCLRTNLFAAFIGQLAGKTAEHAPQNVGMQLGLHHRPKSFLASDNAFLKYASLDSILENSCDVLEMLPDFIGNAPLGVACIVSGKSITATAMRKRVEEIFALAKLAQPQVE